MKGIVLLVIALSLLGAGAADAKEVKWIWKPPVDGTPAESYVVQCQPEGGEWMTVAIVKECHAVIQHPDGKSRIRVAAISILSEQGPWSMPSAWFSTEPPRPTRPHYSISAS